MGNSIPYKSVTIALGDMMSWIDDEPYTYYFEDDCQEDGLAIPPRPDCLRDSDQDSQSGMEPEEADYSRSARKRDLGKVDPKRMKHLKTLYNSVVRLNREKTESSFVNEAITLQDYSVEKARHVPFRSYWPTYEAMSVKQREWYFYVRKKLWE